jgi:hypothetical protein
VSRRFVAAYNCRVAARCIRVVPSARAGSTQCRVIAALHAAAASCQALSVRVGLPAGQHGSAADRHVVSRESPCVANVLARRVLAQPVREAPRRRRRAAAELGPTYDAWHGCLGLGSPRPTPP